MKAAIHPKYNPQAQVTCVCGNHFTVGSTKDVIHVELCYQCHPFYTGQDRFVDTRSKISKFQEKRDLAEQHKAQVTKKKDDKKKQQEGPKSLREMLQSLR